MPDSDQVGLLESQLSDGEGQGAERSTLAPIAAQPLGDVIANLAGGQRLMRSMYDEQSTSSCSIRPNIGANVDLSWHNISVRLPKNKRAKRYNDRIILDNISGLLETGSLAALMGASGAGKTTFLNVISGRSANVLEVEGKLGINGREVSGRNIRKISAYIQQQDLFLPTLTVYEHLYVQAMLRMDNKTPKEDRIAKIHDVMNELGLTKISSTRIGNPVSGGRGISGGEAKRLSFASEILTDPPLLFADEPTSGLDSFAAHSVVTALKALADNGRTIICTIHQPPSEIFNLFQKLILFAEGHTAYLGNLSAAPETFASLGFPCPPAYNYADFYINTLAIKPGEGLECQQRVKVITDAYHEKEAESGMMDPEPPSPQMEQALRDLGRHRGETWINQFRVILWRSFVSSSRNFILVGVQLVQIMVMAILYGLTFLQVGEGNGMKRVQNISGAGLMLLVWTTMTTLYAIAQVLPLETGVLVRDIDNSTYKTWVFFWCKYLADIPFDVTYSLIYCIITYFLIGFRVDAEAFFTFLAIIVVTNQVAKAIGFLISAVAFNDVQLAINMVIVVAVPLMLFSGVFLNPERVPDHVIWIERISMFKYEFQALMINEWRPLTFGSCENVTTICYESGVEVLNTLSLGTTKSDMDYSFGILGVLWVAFLFLALVTLILRVRFVKR